MKQDVFHLILAMVICIVPVVSVAQISQTNLPPTITSDGAAGDNFGKSVSVSGSHAIIGAPENDERFSNAGAAYIFKQVGVQWLKQAKLIADDAAQDDRFGWSVSIDGEYAVIGAPLDDNSKGTNAGSAYVFWYKDGKWNQSKLTASDGYAEDRFGESVSISGDYIVIGAPNKNNLRGAAYVYVRNPQTNSWSQQQILNQNITLAASDTFGKSVSISGTSIIVGIPGKDLDASGDNKGAAYIFSLSGNVWSQTAYITAPDKPTGSYFGTAVSINGSLAIAGAPYADSLKGAAYIFRYSGSAWDAGIRLPSTDIAVNDNFGYAVSIAEGYALVGAPYAGNKGIAYLFKYDGSSWQNNPVKFAAENGVASDFFGGSVSISSYNSGTGYYAGMGAYGNDVKGLNAGAVHFYATSSAPSFNYPPSISDIYDQFTSKGQLIQIDFTVGDMEGGNLTLTALSNNTPLVPTGNMSFNPATPVIPTGGGSVPVTLSITPTSDPSETATITVRVSDSSGNTTEESFVLTVREPPTISDIPDQTIKENAVAGPIVFQIGYGGYKTGNLTLSAASSNTTLVPLSRIVFNQTSGTSTSRTVTITPISNTVGTSTITITVSDEKGNFKSDSFVLTVTGVPKISTLSNITTLENVAPNDVNFTISDRETGDLTVTVSASNNSIISSLGLYHNNEKKELPAAIPVNADVNVPLTLKISLKPYASGTTEITVSVTDSSGNQDTKKFLLTVTAVQDAPIIDDIGNQTMAEDSYKSVTIRVKDMDGGQLTVSFESSNTTLIPNNAANMNISGSYPTYTINVTAGVTEELFLNIAPPKNANSANSSGSTIIKVTVTDNTGKSAFDTFILDVTSVNDYPTIDPITDSKTMNEDDFPATINPVNFEVDDVDGDTLTITAESSNEAIIKAEKLKINGLPQPFEVSKPVYSLSSLQLTITPEKDKNTDGIDPVTITLKVTEKRADGQTALETFGSFTVVVTPQNDFPTVIANEEKVSMNEDTTKTFLFTAGDIDGDTLSLTLETSDKTIIPIDPKNIQINGADYAAGFSLTKAVYSSSVRISVTPQKDAYTANSDGSNDNPVTLFVTVRDAASKTASTKVTITVLEVNDAPTIGAVTNKTINEDNKPLTADNPIALTINDVESHNLLLTVQSDNENVVKIDGTQIKVNGTAYSAGYLLQSGTYKNNPVNLTIIPLPDKNTGGMNPVTITVTVTETEVQNPLNASTSFALTVTPVNDAPAVAPDPVSQTWSIDEDASKTFTFTLTDVDKDDLFLTLQSSNTGVLKIDGDHIKINGTAYTPDFKLERAVYEAGKTNITLLPNANQFSDIPFNVIITVKDGSGLTGVHTVQLTVTPVNDAPTLATISNKTINEDNNPSTLDNPINLTIDDIEGNNLLLTVTSNNEQVVKIDGTQIKVNGANYSAGYLLTSSVYKNNPVKLTIIPLPDKNTGGANPVTITVTVTETEVPNPLNASTSFALTVTPVNDPPKIEADPQVQTWEIEEDSSQTFTFKLTDVDEDDLFLTLQSSNTGVIKIDGDRIKINGTAYTQDFKLERAVYATGKISITISPNPNAFSNNPITIIASVKDGGGLIGTCNFSLTVTPVNDAPTITDIPAQTMNEEDIPSIMNPVKFAVSDVELDPLTITVKSGNTTIVKDENITVNGFTLPYPFTASTYNSGQLLMTIKPEQNQNTVGKPPVLITVTVDDGDKNKSVTFNLTVNAVNDPPTMSDINNLTMYEDPPAAPTVDVKVGDPDADELTITITSTNKTIIPDDKTHIKINNRDYETPFKVTPSEYANALKLAIMPAQDANTLESGPIPVSVTVTDGSGEKVTKSFTVTVEPVNDPPKINQVVPQTIQEDIVTMTPIDVTVTDPDGDKLTITARSGDETIVKIQNIRVNNSTLPVDVYKTVYSAGPLKLTMKPELNANTGQTGPIQITIKAEDARGGVFEMTFDLTVEPVNDLPKITLVDPAGDLPAIMSMNEDGTKLVTFSVVDPDGEFPEVTALSLNTTVVPNNFANLGVSGQSPNFTLTIKPALNANSVKDGIAEINIKADDKKTPVTEKIYLTVNPVNDQPTLSGLEPAASMDEDATKDFPFTVDDVDGDVLTVTATSLNPNLIPNNFTNISVTGTGKNRILTLKPKKDANGSGKIIVVVKDNSGATDGTAEKSFEMMLTVNPINDRPIITDLPPTYTIDEDPAALADIPFKVNDVDNDIMSVLVESKNDKLVPNNSLFLTVTGTGTDRTLRLKSAPNANTDLYGTCDIVITVNDNTGAADSTATATMKLTVSPVNDRPVIEGLPLAYSMDEDGTALELPFKISDPDVVAIDVTTHTVTVESDNQNLIPNDPVYRKITGTGADRVLYLKPLKDAFGNATITITVKDNSGQANDTGIVTLALKVNAINDNPTVSDIFSPQYVKEKESAVVRFRAFDPETTPDQLDITVFSSNTALIPSGEPHLKIEYLTTPFGNLNYQLTITPVVLQTNDPKTSKITIVVSDTESTAQTQFDVIVVASPNAPEILLAATLNMFEDTPQTINFQVKDARVSVDKLNVIAYSSNVELIPNGVGHLDLRMLPVPDAYGNNYEIKITPALNAPKLPITPDTSQAIITVVVNNGEFATSAEMKVTVHPTNDSPKFTGLTTQLYTDENVPVSTAFYISDIETPVNELLIKAYLSNQSDINLALVPTKNMNLTCNDGECELAIVPGLNQSGIVDITVELDDGSGVIGGGAQNPSKVTSIIKLTVGEITDGDIDGNRRVDLTDAILALQMMIGIFPEKIYLGADANKDGKIGIADVIFILQKVSGIR